jgi:hypothetical protein
MATLQAYENGLSMGWPGIGHAPGTDVRRGCVEGWSAGAVRRHTAWLRSVDTKQLDGQGVAVTLTVRECPPMSDDWTRLVKVLQQRLRRAGLLRWHWVVEWQRRGVPHLHLAVYAASEWVPPGWGKSPITDIMSTPEEPTAPGDLDDRARPMVEMSTIELGRSP